MRFLFPYLKVAALLFVSGGGGEGGEGWRGVRLGGGRGDGRWVQLVTSVQNA